MKYDDAELIQLTLEGDQDAFAALVEKYQAQIHAIAWKKPAIFTSPKKLRKMPSSPRIRNSQC